MADLTVTRSQTRFWRLIGQFIVDEDLETEPRRRAADPVAGAVTALVVTGSANRTSWMLGSQNLVFARNRALQLRAWLEARALARRDGDALSRLRIPALTRTSLANPERAESRQRNFIAGRQRALNRVECCVYHSANLCLWLLDLLGNGLDKIAFPHSISLPLLLT